MASRTIRGLQFLVPILLLSLILVSCGKSEEQANAKPTIVFITDSIGKQLEITKAMAKDFETQTGVHVEFEIGPNNSTERLAEYQKFFTAQSSHADVYQIDVIWPGILAPHLLDLGSTIDTKDFFPAMIANDTVSGKLVCVPFYADAGLLYYREDLLKKYHYDAPPVDLDEMQEMAERIQSGERGEGKETFYGFVFQGAAYEGLTCDALEWQVGAEGGRILSPDGKLEVDTPQAREVFDRAKGWIGTIAPRGVLTYMEEESRGLFQSGNAAFMRNWPYAYSLAQADDSPIKGKVGVMAMPGEKRHASVLGGWNLGVSKYSKHPDAAKQFVAFLSTRGAQMRRALEGGYFATRPDVYGDPKLDEVVPYYNKMRDVFLNATVRPSTPAGSRYNEISAAYYSAVHDILAGESTSEEALSRAATKIQEIMER